MFTRIALQKLNVLLQCEKFLTVIAIKDDEIKIKFTGSICTVSSFGNVKWHVKDDIQNNHSK